MRKLSLIILAVLAFVYASGTLFSDSPHGAGFSYSCDLCHSSKGWMLDKEIYSFDHGKTKFPLTGQHESLDCRQCHKSLVFSEASESCNACHTDMHNQTVGPDCDRCHTTTSWIVNNITAIHQVSRFPLVGPHYTTDCSVCHKSASLLRFEPLGVDCYDCHSDDYNSTTAPNHVQGNYSKDCSGCHSMSRFTWTGAVVTHSFFPLTEGHAISDCNKCHPGGNFANTPRECVACHQDNYNATTNPNHSTANIPTTCENCHSTLPGWKPASYTIHDGQYFPIYSGGHQGEWTYCADCHTTPGVFTSFSCTVCHAHNQADMNDEHSDVGGYLYNDQACFDCHPTGSAEGSFNHSTSIFPLTGAHTSTPCNQCHVNGYSGTPTDCFTCHTQAYNATTNPAHGTLSIQTNCVSCHSTQPGWKPALFPDHNNYYQLNGAHALIANDCSKCHKGNYNNTSNICSGCHMEDYNQSSNPPHSAAQFPTDCQSCHTENAWAPSTFDHDGQYFPIYSGKHNGEWNLCSDCHTNSSNYQVFSCITCHEHNQADMNDKHNDVTGYSYNSQACLQCHPNGNGGKSLKPGNPVNKSRL